MKLALLSALILACSTVVFGQTSSPTPSNERLEREQELRDEIRVLKAQIELLNTIRSASGTSNITAATSGGSTTFNTAQQPNLETVSLSYEAVNEISQRIDAKFKPVVSQYRGLVIYHEPDFIALTRYRLYREQVRMALANYEAIVKRIEELGSDGVTGVARPKSVRVFGSEGLVTALSAPSIATSAIKSVAELASLFRTETVITQSKDVVDEDSLGTVVAGTFLNANPNLVVYYPEQFVAEYQIDLADENTLLGQLSRINAAEAYLNYFLAEVAKLPEPERETQPLARIIAAAKVVQSQIRNLGFSLPNERAETAERPGSGTASAASTPRVSDFRQMIRAEKLDRMLKDGRVGIMKIRLLSSGGARREKKNLLLGARTDYSGSAVVEVALYDADGTMRASEIFSHHTGFRKFKTDKEPRL